MNATTSEKRFPSGRPVRVPGVTTEDVVGLAEIAGVIRKTTRIRVTKRTAQNYVAREGFPKPIARLASGPVWKREDVAEWAAANLPLRTGRPPRQSD
jgi:hypothetical protein